MKEPEDEELDDAEKGAEQSPDEALWSRYVRTGLATLAIQLLAVALVIAAANPYGNLPVSLFRGHVIMDTNQRYQYPAIARSGRFDSAVIGTSTSRLLKPAAIEELLGGRFANLALDAATAWDEYRMASLFEKSVARPGTLLIGIDHVWCVEDATRTSTKGREIPEWLFDSNRWNDPLWMLNKTTLEIAGRRLAYAAGLGTARIPFDGYEVFMPPEEAYDLAKAKTKLGAPVAAPADGLTPSLSERARWSYPALDWLEEILRGRWQRVVLYMPPVHVSAQRVGGKGGLWREVECKRRLAALADRHGVSLIDFRIPSDITTRDENYWDRLHVRLPVAERVVRELGEALETGKDDPNGDWQVLAPAH